MNALNTPRLSTPGMRPISGDLKLASRLSFVVALLMAAVSAAGIALGSGSGLYGTDPGLALGATEAEAGLLVPGLLGQDVFNLVVGVPLLLGSMWLARRGSLAGLLLWPGALFYALYWYVLYLVGAPFSALFLFYVPLVAMSAYALIALVSGIDGEQVGRQLVRMGGEGGVEGMRGVGMVPARVAGAILVGLALLTLAQDASGALMTALTGGASLDPVARHVWIADLVLTAPAVLVGGVLLWRRSPLGYVTGAGLLLQYGLTPVGLVAGMALKAILTATPLDVSTGAALLLFAVVCFGTLAFFFLHGATGRERSADLPLAGSHVHSQ